MQALGSSEHLPLQNSNGVQMMDQMLESLQTSVRSLSDSSNQLDPKHGYNPELSNNSMLVDAPHKVEQAEVEFAGINFQVDWFTLSRHRHG